MNPLTVYGLALLLVIGTTTALAGSRGHDGYKNGHRGSQHFKPRGHHYDHYRPHRGRGYYGRYYRPDYYYSSFLGGALIGSALSASLYHSHNGARCYDDHSQAPYQPRSSGNREIVGCHRIQILADGSERRMELPMSQCQ